MTTRDSGQRPTRADTRRPMAWPWRDHEECQVYLLRLDGEVCGRMCKRCNVVEHHLLHDPGHPLAVVLRADKEPVGSA
jgi:hypothetical protein